MIKCTEMLKKKIYIKNIFFHLMYIHLDKYSYHNELIIYKIHSSLVNLIINKINMFIINIVTPILIVLHVRTYREHERTPDFLPL